MNLAPLHSSLLRVLEPEAMDSPADALEYETMDHREVNHAFVADFLTATAQAGLPADAPTLDLGTGTAQIPVELLGQNPRARVQAVELARHMLRLGRHNVAHVQAPAGSIALVLADAKRLPHAAGSFPAVMSNSFVHHVAEPRSVLVEALRVLAAGGLIFVRDLARPADDAQVTCLVAQHAAGATPRQRQLFDDSLRAALSVAEIRALVDQLGYDPRCVQATSDRHWTWSAVKP